MVLILMAELKTEEIILSSLPTRPTLEELTQDSLEPIVVVSIATEMKKHERRNTLI